MTYRTAKTVNFDYQERALEFAIGDHVSPLGDTNVTGRVTEVWPAIGMVDVEWPNGSNRCSVEDLIIVEGGVPQPSGTDNSLDVFHPGEKLASLRTRVAEAWIKQSVYWAARDRQYRASKEEIAAGRYGCPKCKETLRRTSYKRIEGQSVKLLVCPSCMFAIRTKDLEGCHWNTDCGDDVRDDVGMGVSDGIL